MAVRRDYGLSVALNPRIGVVRFKGVYGLLVRLTDFKSDGGP